MSTPTKNEEGSKTSPKGRPKKETSDLSKEIILKTALDFVRAEGVDATSFRALAKRLNVTPMAVSYHVGSKKELISDLIDVAFAGTLKKIAGATPQDRIRHILCCYCERALKNARLLPYIFDDTSTMSSELLNITAEIQANTQALNHGDDRDVLMNVVIDYTHGFVFAASAGEDNPLTIDDFLRNLDWILERAVAENP